MLTQGLRQHEYYRATYQQCNMHTLVEFNDFEIIFFLAYIAQINIDISKEVDTSERSFQ